MLVSARRAISYPNTTRTDQPDIPLHFSNLIAALDLDTPFYTGTFAAMPAAGTRVQGSWYWATDQSLLYFNNGAAWIALAPNASPALSGTPTAPTPGSTDNSTKVATTAFVRTILPPGVVVAFAGSAAPTGWLLCDGTLQNRTTQAALFSAIGTLYGAGDGSTTFGIPDLRGRVPVGKDSGTFATMGAVGGEQTHLLTTTEIPSHTHTFTTGTESADHTHSGVTGGRSAAHTHTYTQSAVVGTAGAGSFQDVVVGWTNQSTSTESSDHTHSFTTGGRSAAHTHSGTTDATGGGTAHNNLQPYQVVNWIIKT